MSSLIISSLFFFLNRHFRDCDWKHQLLKSSLLKERFPWMNLDDVALGCLGMNKEGM